MPAKKTFIKSVAVALLISFVFIEIGRAAPLQEGAVFSEPLPLNQDPLSFQPPLDFVTMKELHRGQGDTLIIHIQDAHSNLSGQENLAAALDDILGRYKISLVLSEGGAGDCSLTGIKKIAPAAAWKKIAKSYLVQGRITGEEYLNLVSDHPMKIVGLEDLGLYMKSVQNYAELADKREATISYLRGLRTLLDKLKRKLYPPSIAEYEAAKARPNSESPGIDVKALMELAQKNAVALDEFPNLMKLAELALKEKLINFDLANLEQAALLEEIAEKGGASELGADLKKPSQMKGQKLSQFAYFQNTFRIAKDKKILLAKYPQLLSYAEYLKDFSDVDIDRVLEESQRAEDKIYKSLLSSQAEAEDLLLVRSLDRYFGLLETAYNVRMTTGEFGEWTANNPDFDTVRCLAFLNRKLIQLGYAEDLAAYRDFFESGHRALLDFYDSVAKRDEEFLKNAEKAMKESGQKTAVLITGGYHTAHLKKLFMERGHSIAVLTPIVTAPTNQKKYEKLLLAPIRPEAKKVELSEERRGNDVSLGALGEEFGPRKKTSDGVRAALLRAGTGTLLLDPEEKEILLLVKRFHESQNLSFKDFLMGAVTSVEEYSAQDAATRERAEKRVNEILTELGSESSALSAAAESGETSTVEKAVVPQRAGAVSPISSKAAEARPSAGVRLSALPSIPDNPVQKGRRWSKKREEYLLAMHRLLNPKNSPKTALLMHSAANIRDVLWEANPDVLILCDRLPVGNSLPRRTREEKEAIKAKLEAVGGREDGLKKLSEEGSNLLEQLFIRFESMGISTGEIKPVQIGPDSWQIDYEWRHPREAMVKKMRIYFLGSAPTETINFYSWPREVLDWLRIRGGLDYFFEQAPNYYGHSSDEFERRRIADALIRQVNSLKVQLLKRSGYAVGDFEARDYQLWKPSSNRRLLEKSHQFKRVKMPVVARHAENEVAWGNSDAEVLKRVKGEPVFHLARKVSVNWRAPGRLLRSFIKKLIGVRLSNESKKTPAVSSRRAAGNPPLPDIAVPDVSSLPFQPMRVVISDSTRAPAFGFEVKNRWEDWPNVYAIEPFVIGADGQSQKLRSGEVLFSIDSDARKLSIQSVDAIRFDLGGQSRYEGTGFTRKMLAWLAYVAYLNDWETENSSQGTLSPALIHLYRQLFADEVEVTGQWMPWGEMEAQYGFYSADVAGNIGVLVESEDPAHESIQLSRKEESGAYRIEEASDASMKGAFVAIDEKGYLHFDKLAAAAPVRVDVFEEKGVRVKGLPKIEAVEAALRPAGVRLSRSPLIPRSSFDLIRGVGASSRKNSPKEIASIEGMKVSGGKPGLWINGFDLSERGRMEEYSRKAAAAQEVLSEKGVQFVVDRSRFGPEEARQVEAALRDVLRSLPDDQTARIIRHQNSRNEGYRPIVITKLEDAAHLFEDHKANGFIGIHRKLFDTALGEGLIRKILWVGLEHELKHEALVGERNALRKRLQKDESEVDRLGVEEIKALLTDDLEKVVEAELFEEDIDKAAELGLTYEDLEPLVEAGILSGGDGFVGGLRFHGNVELRSRHREFLKKHDAENHLIDRTDPEFHEVYEAAREIFDRLLVAAGLDASFYHLYLSDENEPNAFYLRGSNVFVLNLGLLRLLSKDGRVVLSKDAIAFVLAHEIQHLRQYRADVLKGSVSSKMEIKVDWKWMSDERKQEYLDEYDADWNAVDLMSRAGFNVREAPRVFRALLDLIRSAPVGGTRSVYLPFGDHPQLEPRTLELEDLVLRRYWPNSSKPVSSFSESLAIPVSRFRDFQKRVYAMNSDEEFAELVMEAKDIRELALVISVGKQRRGEPDYQHVIADEVNHAVYALMNAALKLRQIDQDAKKQKNREEYEKIRAEAREVIERLPQMPNDLVFTLKEAQDTKDMAFSPISFTGTDTRGMPWGEEKTFSSTSGGQAGDIVLMKDGNIVIIPSGELGTDETIEVVTLTGKKSYFIQQSALRGGKVIVIRKARDSLSVPKAPVQALEARVEQLIAAQPEKRLQLKFYLEIFKKHFYRSGRFSARPVSSATEFDAIFRRHRTKKEAAADPAEFDSFVRGVATQELVRALQDLVPVWISLEDEPSGIHTAYRDFKSTLEGSEDGYFYVRGDYIEFVDAIAREVERRIQDGSESVDVIPELVAALEKKEFVQGYMREQSGASKLRLFTIYINRLLADQASLSPESAQALLGLLNKLHFLADSQSYLKKDDQASKMQDQIAQLLYALYKNPETRDAVASLFQKHAKTFSPIKDKVHEIIRNDGTIDLDEKLHIVDELGRGDPRGLFYIYDLVMKAPEGQADAYVDRVIAEIAAKKPSLAALQDASAVLKRLVALVYRGAFSVSGTLIFEVFDADKRELFLDADELRLFRAFIGSDIQLKEKMSAAVQGFVTMDERKQLILFLALFEFLKRNDQEAFIFRVLLDLSAGRALGNASRWEYLYAGSTSLTKTEEGLQYDRDMRTFSMFLGELINRDAENDLQDAWMRYTQIELTAPEEQGYSAKQMAERLKGKRPQRFGRWDMMQDGDKDPLGYFSFLEEIYSGRSFREAVEDLAGNFPESRLRDMLIYAVFAQKVLRDKLGIQVTSDKLFDFEWLRERVRETGDTIHEEVQAALPFFGWDRDIQKLNAKFLAEAGNDALSVDQAAYEREKPSYEDLRFYDIGGRDAQLALGLASLDEAYLREFLSGNDSAEAKLTMLLHYYPATSAYRDRYVRQMLEQLLSSLEAGVFELTAGIEVQVLKVLEAFQNVSMKERYALRFLEHRLGRIQALKGRLSLEDERDEILKYLPNFSYVRDEVLNQFVNRQVKTSKQYKAVASLFVHNPENIRESESADHLFWKEQLRDVFMNFGASAKMEFLLWLMGMGEKPLDVVREEYRLHISFDGLKESFGFHEGRFYSGIGKRDQQEFFRSLFLGESGIFANSSAYEGFLDEIISNLIPADRKAVRELFKGVLTTDDLVRRQRILLGLLQNYGRLQGIADPEEKEAKSIRVFLEANGLIGIKLGQFFAHSTLVKPGSYLQKELQELNDAAESIDKGILFDMLEKVYDGRAFEDHFESLDELIGAASVKVVYKAALKDGTVVAIKFKRPEVDKQIEQDLAFLESVLGRFAPVLTEEGIPIPAGLLDRLKEIMDEELDFDREAASQRRVKESIEPRKTKTRDGVTYEFSVPVSDGVYENSVMVEEFAGGIPLKKEAALRAVGVDPEAVKELLMEELLQQFFFDGFYHADLHSGNVFVQKAGEITHIRIIDLGASAEISAANREALVALLMTLWDKDNWEANREVVHRMFPQIETIPGMAGELLEIIGADRNPIQKLMGLFALLEKNNIAFQGEYRQFYSIIRFLKASEYLFSDAMLEKMKVRFFPSDIEHVKAKASAIATEVKRELSEIQAPVVDKTPGGGMAITVTAETMEQAHEALERLRGLPFWPAVTGPFPQLNELVDLMLGVLRRFLDKGESLRIRLSPEEMPVYEDIKLDVEFLAGLLRAGGIGPVTAMKALGAVRRIAGRREAILDFILRQNIPVQEIVDSVRTTAGLEAAEKLETLIKSRRAFGQKPGLDGAQPFISGSRFAEVSRMVNLGGTKASVTAKNGRVWIYKIDRETEDVGGKWFMGEKTLAYPEEATDKELLGMVEAALRAQPHKADWDYEDFWAIADQVREWIERKKAGIAFEALAPSSVASKFIRNPAGASGFIQVGRRSSLAAGVRLTMPLVSDRRVVDEESRSEEDVIFRQATAYQAFEAAMTGLIGRMRELSKAGQPLVVGKQIKGLLKELEGFLLEYDPLVSLRVHAQPGRRILTSVQRDLKTPNTDIGIAGHNRILEDRKSRLANLLRTKGFFGRRSEEGGVLFQTAKADEFVIRNEIFERRGFWPRLKDTWRDFISQTQNDYDGRMGKGSYRFMTDYGLGFPVFAATDEARMQAHFESYLAAKLARIRSELFGKEAKTNEVTWAALQDLVPYVKNVTSELENASEEEILAVRGKTLEDLQNIWRRAPDWRENGPAARAVRLKVYLSIADLFDYRGFGGQEVHGRNLEINAILSELAPLASSDEGPVSVDAADLERLAGDLEDAMGFLRINLKDGRFMDPAAFHAAASQRSGYLISVDMAGFYVEAVKASLEALAKYMELLEKGFDDGESLQTAFALAMQAEHQILRSASEKIGRLEAVLRNAGLVMPEIESPGMPVLSLGTMPGGDEFLGLIEEERDLTPEQMEALVRASEEIGLRIVIADNRRSSRQRAKLAQNPVLSYATVVGDAMRRDNDLKGFREEAKASGKIPQASKGGVVYWGKKEEGGFGAGVHYLDPSGAVRTENLSGVRLANLGDEIVLYLVAEEAEGLRRYRAGLDGELALGAWEPAKASGAVADTFAQLKQAISEHGKLSDVTDEFVSGLMHHTSNWQILRALIVKLESEPDKTLAEARAFLKKGRAISHEGQGESYDALQEYLDGHGRLEKIHTYELFKSYLALDVARDWALLEKILAALSTDPEGRRALVRRLEDTELKIAQISRWDFMHRFDGAWGMRLVHGGNSPIGENPGPIDLRQPVFFSQVPGYSFDEFVEEGGFLSVADVPVQSILHTSWALFSPADGAYEPEFKVRGPVTLKGTFSGDDMGEDSETETSTEWLEFKRAYEENLRKLAGKLDPRDIARLERSRGVRLAAEDRLLDGEVRVRLTSTALQEDHLDFSVINSVNLGLDRAWMRWEKWVLFLRERNHLEGIENLRSLGRVLRPHGRILSSREIFRGLREASIIGWSIDGRLTIEPVFLFKHEADSGNFQEVVDYTASFNSPYFPDGSSAPMAEFLHRDAFQSGLEAPRAIVRTFNEPVRTLILPAQPDKISLIVGNPVGVRLSQQDRSDLKTVESFGSVTVVSEKGLAGTTHKPFQSLLVTDFGDLLGLLEPLARLKENRELTIVLESNTDTHVEISVFLKKYEAGMFEKSDPENDKIVTFDFEAAPAGGVVKLGHADRRFRQMIPDSERRLQVQTLWVGTAMEEWLKARGFEEIEARLLGVPELQGPDGVANMSLDFFVTALGWTRNGQRVYKRLSGARLVTKRDEPKAPAEDPAAGVRLAEVVKNLSSEFRILTQIQEDASIDAQFFKNIFDKMAVILFGEVHNPPTTRKFLSKHIDDLVEAKITHLLLEFPMNAQHRLEEYLETRDPSKITGMFSAEELQKYDVDSLLELIDAAHAHDIAIRFIDVPTWNRDLEDRLSGNVDQTMAGQIAVILQESPSARIAGLVGTGHAHHTAIPAKLKDRDFPILSASFVIRTPESSSTRRRGYDGDIVDLPAAGPAKGQGEFLSEGVRFSEPEVAPQAAARQPRLELFDAARGSRLRALTAEAEGKANPSVSTSQISTEPAPVVLTRFFGARFSQETVRDINQLLNDPGALVVIAQIGLLRDKIKSGELVPLEFVEIGDALLGISRTGFDLYDAGDPKRPFIGHADFSEEILDKAAEANRSIKTPKAEAISKLSEKISAVVDAHVEAERKNREADRVLEQALSRFSGAKTLVLSVVPDGQKADLLGAYVERLRKELNEKIASAKEKASKEGRDFELTVLIEWVDAQGRAISSFEGVPLASDDITGLRPGAFERIYIGTLSDQAAVQSRRLLGTAQLNGAGLLGMQEVQASTASYNVVPYAATLKAAVIILISDGYNEAVGRFLTHLIQGTRSDIRVGENEYAALRRVPEDAQVERYIELAVQAVMRLDLKQFLEYAQLALQAIGSAA